MDVDTVLELFRDEVEEMGGRVFDVIRDDHRLFTRSTLPESMPVVDDDVVESGLALRYVADEVEIRPYVHRLVCRNGQILAFSPHGRFIPVYTPAVAKQAIREGIREAAAPGAFRACVSHMREAMSLRPDPALLLLELGRRSLLDREALLDLLERFQAEPRFNLYALGNAMTAMARDTRDPQERWDRECLGAAIFARLIRPAPARDVDASLPLADEAEGSALRERKRYLVP